MAMPHASPSDAVSDAVSGRRDAAHALAKALPRLTLEARRVAMSVQTGLHGRRRAGAGESFWQFRPFTQGEAANRIDWRRSGRDEHLYVREREWEAAHTVWLWIDQSPSMAFRSQWALDEKGHHAVILGLALADLLVRGGERVGHWQSGCTSQQRRIIDQLALMLIEDAPHATELPAARRLDRLHDMILITDGLSPLEDWTNHIENLSQSGARGHLVLIRDLAEVTLPYEGQYRLQATEGTQMLDIGDAAAFRSRYQHRMNTHVAGLRTLCARHHWHLHDHRTDKPLAPLLLALAGHLMRHPSLSVRQG